jgi:hypothetical protein
MMRATRLLPGFTVAGFVCAVAAGALWAQAGPGPQGTGQPAAQAGQSAAGQETTGGQNEHLEVPPPPFTEGIFPCSTCHASMKVNRTRRELTEMHTDIVLKHGSAQLWCLDCHNADNRDVLHLASGELVPFDESYRLCGQCHGEKYRDWRVGVHGRRTGQWNGHKTYLLCVNCHNPHQPHFKPLVPMPAPVPPTRPGK